MQPEALQQENRDMPRVKVRRAAQITLPAEVRRKLGVAEGDYLDMELVENGVLLKPAREREEPWRELFAAAGEVRDVAPKPGQSPTEEEEIAEAVKAFRREHA